VKVFYFLDRPPRLAESFILREIREVMRQGTLVEVAYPLEGAYRVEGAETVLGLAGPGGAGTLPGRAVNPAWAPAAVARAILASSMEGARRVRRHTAGDGRALGSGFRQAVPLAREAKRFGAEILHAHFASRACEDAMLASWLTRLPFTFTAHGYDVHREPPPDYPIRGRAATAVVTVSENNARVLSQRHGVPERSIHVIPCGVDTDRFKPREGEEPGLIVSVIRLHLDKGPDILVDAAEELLRQGRNFRMEILGDGELREALQARLSGPLAEKVSMPGRADERSVMESLNRASLFVLPSRTEGMPVALMEAMASGKAVVATRVGGVPELLEEGRSGVIVAPEDPPALAGALSELLADPARRRALGSAARDRVVDRFRLSECTARLVALWREGVRAHRERLSRAR
jgi:glycosyltransferase involved in cell wall biosynthesis